MRLFGPMLLAVVLIGTACSEATAPGEPITALPRPLTASETKIIAASNDFAFYNADFTRMSPRGLDLFITRVLQKTFVDVNEEGTEAAAATLVGVGVVSLPQAFRADRPFLVVIRERFSGTILFIGKIANLPV